MTIVIFPSLNDGKIECSRKSIEKVTDFYHMTQLAHIDLLEQSGVTGGGLDPYTVHS